MNRCLCIRMAWGVTGVMTTTRCRSKLLTGMAAPPTMAAMHCPACKDEVLVALELDQVEVDYCTGCRGIWLDAGELELLFGDRDMAGGFLHAGETSPESLSRKCPICGTAMQQHTTGGANPIIWDGCPNDDGLWLDHGELAGILRHGSPAPGGEAVAAWLREMFPAESA